MGPWEKGSGGGRSPVSSRLKEKRSVIEILDKINCILEIRGKKQEI